MLRFYMDVMELPGICFVGRGQKQISDRELELQI